MVTLASKIINFYRSLQIPVVPKAIDVLYPQQSEDVMNVVENFFNKFYNNNSPRRLIFGINPGRFGGGTTGINFTAPNQLSEFCHIDHPFKPQSELSAEFIYDLIVAYGGVTKFYGDYFVTAVSPLGFVRNGVNLNYYDDKKLQQIITPFIIDSIRKQISFGFKTDHCFCIGGDKNLKFFSSLNDDHNFFDRIIPLAHPRFIMQYRRKQKAKFIEEYLSVLKPLS